MYNTRSSIQFIKYSTRGRLLIGAAVGMFFHIIVTYSGENRAFNEVIKASSSSWLQEHLTDISEGSAAKYLNFLWGAINICFVSRNIELFNKNSICIFHHDFRTTLSHLQYLLRFTSVILKYHFNSSLTPFCATTSNPFFID